MEDGRPAQHGSIRESGSQVGRRRGQLAGECPLQGEWASCPHLPMRCARRRPLDGWICSAHGPWRRGRHLSLRALARHCVAKPACWRVSPSRRVGILPTAHEMSKKKAARRLSLLCAWAMAAGRHHSLRALARHCVPKPASELSVRPQKRQCVEQVGFPEAHAGLNADCGSG